MATFTPLRYPGGKGKMGPFLADFLKINDLDGGTYVEPYAGGAGAALYLLLHGHVKRLILNDIDPAVFSFWNSVLNETERFAKYVEHVPLTIAEWEAQKKVHRSAGSGFELGFAFFYLNRTNRSGIMNEGGYRGSGTEGEMGNGCPV